MIPGETAQLRELIAERQRLETIRDITDDIGASGEQAFMGLMKGAASLSDALISVLDRLADIAASTVWDMFWQGTGGSSGLSGLVSSLVGGLLPGGGGAGVPTLAKAITRADGGPIHGPGGPRDDKVLMWGSNGEFVVNAAATAANRDLVEAINAGASRDQLAALMTGARPPRLQVLTGQTLATGWWPSGGTVASIAIFTSGALA